MKYEIRRDSEIQDEKRTTVTLKEPQWVIYFEGKKNIAPFLMSFETVYDALKHFINGIGTNEGITRISIETNKQEP
jgi:hypothetical protein